MPTAPPVPTTEGQRLLLELGLSVRKMAEAVGCSRSLAGFWRKGEKLPGLAYRTTLNDLYGIPPGSWECPPGQWPPEPTESRPEIPEAKNTLDEVNNLINLQRRLLNSETLTPAQETKVISDYAKLLALKARLEDKRTMIEAKIVESHPAYRRTMQRLLDALRPFPEAALAAAEALKPEAA